MIQYSFDSDQKIFEEKHLVLSRIHNDVGPAYVGYMENGLKI